MGPIINKLIQNCSKQVTYFIRPEGPFMFKFRGSIIQKFRLQKLECHKSSNRYKYLKRNHKIAYKNHY